MHTAAVTKFRDKFATLRHVFDKISSKFHGVLPLLSISCIDLNFCAVALPRKIAEALCEVKVEKWNELLLKASANKQTFRKHLSDFSTQS